MKLVAAQKKAIVNAFTTFRFVTVLAVIITGSINMGSFHLGDIGDKRDTWAFKLPIQQLVAFTIGVSAIFSDLIDGFLARKWKVASQFGRMLDLTADIMLMLVAATMMAVWGCCRWWYAGCFLITWFVLSYLVWILRDDFVITKRSNLRKFQFMLLVFYFWFCQNHFPHVMRWQGELMRTPIYLVLVIQIFIIIKHFKSNYSKIKLTLTEPSPDRNKRLYS